MERLTDIGLLEEDAHSVEEGACDRLVIALGVAVHPADALVEAADDARQLGVEFYVRPANDEINRGGEMRFVRPVFARQSARKQPLAETFDLGVGREKSWRLFDHGIGS